MTTQSQDIPIASPVLDYATHDADGTPDWLPEAEARIEKGCKPTAIRDLFRNPLQAVRYYGKSMSRRYGPASLGGACVSCGAKEPAYAIAVTWGATVHPHQLKFSVHGEQSTTFDTMHSLCTACVTPWMSGLAKIARRRRRLGVVRTTMFIAWIVALIAIRSVIRTYFTGRTTSEFWFPGIWVGFICVGLILQFVDYTFLRAVPRYFRKLMPRDVRFGGITGAFRRVNGQLQSLW